jgi:hypothetical protein
MHKSEAVIVGKNITDTVGLSQVLEILKNLRYIDNTTISFMHISSGYHNLLGKADFADTLEISA